MDQQEATEEAERRVTGSSPTASVAGRFIKQSNANGQIVIDNRLVHRFLGDLR
jgi:hypothetical protein